MRLWLAQAVAAGRAGSGTFGALTSCARPLLLLAYRSRAARAPKGHANTTSPRPSGKAHVTTCAIFPDDLGFVKFALASLGHSGSVIIGCIELHGYAEQIQTANKRAVFLFGYRILSPTNKAHPKGQPLRQGCAPPPCACAAVGYRGARVLGARFVTPAGV